eukprot:gene41908-2587_t
MHHLIVDLNLTTADKATLEDSGACNFHRIPLWTFTGSMFYCLTVITTIGYGSFTPGTINGKSFTTVMAIFGIAIVGQLLTSLAELLRGTCAALAARRRGTTQPSSLRSLREEHRAWE